MLRISMTTNTYMLSNNVRGYSLTELMLATTLFMLLAAGALTLLVYARKTLNAIENMAELQERAAFVLALLEDDIRLAGYWGLHTNGALLSAAESVAVRCGNKEISAWALQTELAFELADNSYPLPCPPYTQSAVSTDTLVLRHASPAVVTTRAGTIQILTSHDQGIIFSDGIKPELNSPAVIHNLQINAWYVDQASSESGLPALRRYTLTHNGVMQNQEIMPGVEDLQILLGIDNNGDGHADKFISSEQQNKRPVVALQVQLQLRSSFLEPGHINTSFNMNDGYRRLKVARTIALKNRQRS